MNNKERIIDKVNLNHFGVLFHDTRVIEEFQSKSGMDGPYSKEYQHHYINLVGRLDADDGQRLDIAIPMAMYNYHQEVGGASVEFSLVDVSEANEQAMEIAKVKAEKFMETPLFKHMVELGITDWTLYGMNSIHAHPTGVNRFSGTDLRADISHPGVNFPLSVGSDVPNFASIIQHKQDHAEIIHTEYRIFNGEEGGERVYEKGRCLTIIRGFEEEEPKEEEPKGPGSIDVIFGTSRPTPPPKPKPKERKDYILEDGFTQIIDKESFESTKKELMELWKQTEFDIDTSMILEENVTVGRGRLLNRTNNTMTHDSERFGTLFSGYATHRSKGKNKENKSGTKPLYEMKRELVDSGLFTWVDFQAMSNQDIRDEYEDLLLYNEEEKQPNKSDNVEFIRQFLKEEEVIDDAGTKTLPDRIIIELFEELYE